MNLQQNLLEDLDTSANPPLNQDSLRRFHQTLESNLAFPFPAVYHEPVGQTGDATHQVTVVGLCDPSTHSTKQGLLCRAVRHGELVELPLVEIEVSFGNLNFELIEKYWSWAWNELYSATSAQ